MFLRCCVSCKYHNIKIEDGQKLSHCSKENCWSQYSKCILSKAMERFLVNENIHSQQEFSALAHVYSIKD